MLKRLFAYCLPLLFTIGATTAPKPKTCSIEELAAMLPDKVASIDGKEISRQEFLKYFQAQMPGGRIPQRLDDTRAPYALAAQAEQMVTARLIERYLAEHNVKGSPAIVDAYYRKQLETLRPDERALLEYRLKLQKKTVDSWIAAQAKNPQIQQELAAFEFFEKKYTEKIEIPDADIRKYYDSNTFRFNIPEMVEVSHILLTFHPKKPKEKEAAAKRAAELAAELQKNPSSFSAVAQKESKCPSASQGGKLGAIGKNMMDKKFEEAAFALAPGAISGVVETPGGFHIIRCDARNATRRMTFDEVKGPITDMLKRQEALKRMEQLVAELKTKYKAELFVKMPEYRAIPMEIPADVKP